MGCEMGRWFSGWNWVAASHGGIRLGRDWIRLFRAKIIYHWRIWAHKRRFLAKTDPARRTARSELRRTDVGSESRAARSGASV